MSEQTAVKEMPLSLDREVSSEEFLKICNSLIPEIYQIHEKENGPLSDHEQTFHRVEPHVSVVVKRVKDEIDVIRKIDPNLITPVQEGRALLFAALHDLEQQRHIKDPQYKDTIREQIQRESGRNEKDTAERAIQIMRDVNDRYGKGKKVFISEDVDVCRPTMDATIAKWYDNLGTVIQEGFTQDIPIEAKLVALADTGAAGCDPDHFMEDGNNEFKEVRTGITKLIKQAPRDKMGGPILENPDDKKYAHNELINWFSGQEDWVNGREARLDIELGFFNEDPRIAPALKSQLYNRFGESRAKAQQRSHQATGTGFEVAAKLARY